MNNLNEITHSDLKQKLRQGTVKFYYRKLSGELRVAVGTLDLNKLPQDKLPKGGTKYGNATSYFDLEKGEWRSVSENQNVWID